MPAILQKRLLHYVALVALGVLVYAGTLGFPFQFDDMPNIVNNPIIKSVSFFSDPSRAAGFDRYEALRSRYIGYLTFFLDFRIHGLHVAGYHAVNILIHVCNVLLVYALVILSFQTPGLRGLRLSEMRGWTALLAASLFAVHPANTQAVTYIVQRLASLAALFYLGSMVCYIKVRLSVKRIAQWEYYLLCLACCVAAMKTKENAFTLPLAIALYEVMFFRKEKGKSRAILLLPLLLSMLIIPLTLVDLDSPASHVMADVAEKTALQPIGRAAYLLTEMRVIATYVRLLILPMNQNLDYNYPIFSSIAALPVIFSFMLIAALLALLIYLYSKKHPAARLASFGIVFFFLALCVESTLIPLYPIYEHRLYLPGVGIMAAVSVGAVWLYGTFQDSRSRGLFVLLCVSVIMVLAIQTVERNAVWRSEVTLWSDVVEKAPDNARAQMAMGIAFDRLRNFEQAQEHYMSAIKLRPNFADAYVNLGASYGMSGKLTDALETLEQAIRLDPRNDDAYNNLGNVFFAKGELDEAARYYSKALNYNPGAVSPRVNLVKIFIKQGKMLRAREELGRLKMIAPEQAKALASLFKE